MNYLISSQIDSGGDWYNGHGSLEGGGSSYGHHIATWALAEALLVGGSAQTGGCDEGECDVVYQDLYDAVDRAAEHSDWNYVSSTGGWRYSRFDEYDWRFIRDCLCLGGSGNGSEVGRTRIFSHQLLWQVPVFF